MIALDDYEKDNTKGNYLISPDNKILELCFLESDGDKNESLFFDVLKLDKKLLFLGKEDEFTKKLETLEFNKR